MIAHDYAKAGKGDTLAARLAEHREMPHFQRFGVGAIVALLERREVSRYRVEEGEA